MLKAVFVYFAPAFHRLHTCPVDRNRPPSTTRHDADNPRKGSRGAYAHFCIFAAEEFTPRHNMTMNADRNNKNQNLVLEKMLATTRSGGSLFRTVLTDIPLNVNIAASNWYDRNAIL